MTRHRLTHHQRSVYEFIKTYLIAKRYAPYIHEIQEACGIHSYKSAVDRLLALERKGFIQRMPNKHRGIVLVKPEPLIEEKPSSFAGSSVSGGVSEAPPSSVVPLHAAEPQAEASDPVVG